MPNTEIINKCKTLLLAFKEGKLGQTKMPENSNPGFSYNEIELRLAYFTLPMALNYQRDSYKLWEAAMKTYNDPTTKIVYEINKVALMDENLLREMLTRYKLALQPNKHIATWQKIAKTIKNNWGTMENMFKSVDYDFLKLKEIIQIKFKRDFPYLSGPKIFNYWSFIIQEYGKIKLKNSEFIEIAPDTHITQCSIKLGVITKDEAENLTKEKISEKWREVLKGTNIHPIDMHPPLWFWSRNGFLFKVD